MTRAAARLASFGAVSGNDILTGGCVITPLGRWAAGRLRTMLAGPGEDLSAAELIAYLAECAEDDRFEHAWNWLDAQPGPVDAARRLLVAGASMEPRLRWIATYAVELLGEDALPVWRDMVQVPGIGPHARFALYEMEAGWSRATRSGCGSRSSQPPGRSPRAGRTKRSPCSGTAFPRSSWPPTTWTTAWPWPAQAITRRRDRSRRR